MQLEYKSNIKKLLEEIYEMASTKTITMKLTTIKKCELLCGENWYNICGDKSTKIKLTLCRKSEELLSLYREEFHNNVDVFMKHVKHTLLSKSSKSIEMFFKWCLASTEKGYRYHDNLDTSHYNSFDDVRNMVCTSIGLRVNGSIKSAVGKRIEKDVLKTMFKLLDFQLVDSNLFYDNLDLPLNQRKANLFCLSHTREREIDCAVSPNCAENGIIYIDFTLSGKSNSEIGLDKASRYARELENRSTKMQIHSLVIVNEIATKGKSQKQIEKSGASIFSIKGKNIIYDVAVLLETMGYKSSIIDSLDKKQWIKNKIGENE